MPSYRNRALARGVAGDGVLIICLQAIAQQEEALWDEMLSAAGTIAEDARRRYKEAQQVSFSSKQEPSLTL